MSSNLLAEILLSLDPFPWVLKVTKTLSLTVLWHCYGSGAKRLKTEHNLGKVNTRQEDD